MAKIVNFAWDRFAKGILSLTNKKESLVNKDNKGIHNYSKLPMLIMVPREHTTNICSKCYSHNTLMKKHKQKSRGMVIYHKQVTCHTCREKNDTDTNAANILQQYGLKIIENISKELNNVK